MKPRKKTYTMEIIAQKCGLKASTVRRHHRQGWFDLSDLGSVSEYIVGQNLLRKGKK